MRAPALSTVSVAPAVPGRRGELARAAAPALFAALPAAVTTWILLALAHRHTLAIDVTGWYWPSAWRVLHGLSPYALPPEQALHYPAVGALLLAPLGLVSSPLAGWVLTGMTIASVPALLWLLGVRDWRVFGVAFLWQPVIVGWSTGNVSLLIALGLAVVWRCRDRPGVVAGVLAVLISVKVFIAPVVVWLLATRRYRAAVWTVAGTVVANLAAWAVLGFSEIDVYLRALRGYSRTFAHQGYGVISLLENRGMSGELAAMVGLVAGILVICWGLGSRGPSRDRVVLAACVVAGLVLSPLVEAHYFTVLLVPLALRAPRLGAVWLAPIVLMLAPADHPLVWQWSLLLVTCTGVSAVALAGSDTSAIRWARRAHWMATP